MINEGCVPFCGVGGRGHSFVKSLWQTNLSFQAENLKHVTTIVVILPET